MKFSKKSYGQIVKALEHWKDQNLLNVDKVEKLKAAIQPVGFDFSRLAKYSFWIAIVCFVTAINSIFMDRILMKLLEKIFKAPLLVKFISMTLAASFFYYLGFKKRQTSPDYTYRNEAIFFAGVLSTAGAIYILGKLISLNNEHFSLLILLGCFVYATLGLILNSPLIWLFALLSFGSWFGCETGYQSGWGSYYLGMNYPLRFVLFGGILISLAFVMKKYSKFITLRKTTLAMGLLYLFIALWILSIFGNYDSVKAWSKVKQIELLHWSLLFFMASAASIYYGIKSDDHMTRSFGLVFLFINLYTRYFEFFWDSIHKSIFFTILGGSLWYIGSKAERFSLISKSSKSTIEN
jgi:hypothetical protein